MASRDGDRAAALGRQLSQAHQVLRRQISEIRTSLGHRRSSDGALVTHCLAFCTALSSHHQGEDDGMFSQLLRERPDLAATVAKLVEDHGMIASILSRVRELADRAANQAADRAADGAAGARGPALDAIARELDGLAAIMESHFGYEERTISKALDTVVPDTDWPDMVFRFDRFDPFDQGKPPMPHRPTASITEFPVSDRAAGPYGITAGPEAHCGSPWPITDGSAG